MDIKDYLTKISEIKREIEQGLGRMYHGDLVTLQSHLPQRLIMKKTARAICLSSPVAHPNKRGNKRHLDKAGSERWPVTFPTMFFFCYFFTCFSCSSEGFRREEILGRRRIQTIDFHISLFMSRSLSKAFSFGCFGVVSLSLTFFFFGVSYSFICCIVLIIVLGQ